MQNTNETAKGFSFAIGAYVIWGVVPVYFKLLDHLPVTEIFLHRIVWSIVFTGAIVIFLGRLPQLVKVLTSPRNLLVLGGSAFFIGCNWMLFIWGSNNQHLIEVSLGYYINPLMNIALGLLFLKESLRSSQWIALSLAIIGVLIQVISLGKIPFVSLGLAMAFSFYGFLRKLVKVNSLDGLLVETLFLAVPSSIYFWFFTDKVSLTPNMDVTTLLLILAGPVTSIPLILFAAGVQRLHYSTIGFIQYLAPSIALMLAVFVYKEPLVWQKALTFIFIWFALIIYTADSFYRSRKRKYENSAT